MVRWTIENDVPDPSNFVAFVKVESLGNEEKGFFRCEEGLAGAGDVLWS